MFIHIYICVFMKLYYKIIKKIYYKIKFIKTQYK